MRTQDPEFLKKVTQLNDRVDGWLGGALPLFEQHGRNQLAAFLSQGGFPHHKLLDAGCGVLRGGFWFIHFLNRGNYYGLEILKRQEQRHIEAALEILFDKETRESKRPTFRYNDEFDYSVFGQVFDYVIIRSIWTHESQRLIEKSLDSFLAHTHEKGVLSTTYLRTFCLEDEPREDTRQRAAQYTFDWIESVCDERGLRVQEFFVDDGFGAPGISARVKDDQTWLRIERKPPRTRR